jgi:hypothetical protein
MGLSNSCRSFRYSIRLDSPLQVLLHLVVASLNQATNQGNQATHECEQLERQGHRSNANCSRDTWAFSESQRSFAMTKESGRVNDLLLYFFSAVVHIRIKLKAGNA